MLRLLSNQLFALALGFFLLSLGCDSSSTGPASSKSGGATDASSGGDEVSVSQLVGQIKVEGSSTVEPITNQAKERFNKLHAEVEISVGGEGTSNGFKSFVKKETDISDASRPIKQKELDGCRESGLGFIEVPVAYDGLTIAVNPENDFVSEMTLDDLKKIFRSDGAAKTWKEVNDAWPDEKISIFAPGTGSGTYDYFVEVVTTEKDAEGNKTEIPLRDDDQINLNENDNQLVRGVAGDKYAIGFFGYSYYERNEKELKSIAIVNKAGDAISPTKETIESGEYNPFSRPLFIYLNVESIDRAEVAEFVDFYMDNIREIVDAASYVALPESIYETGKKNIEQRFTGTHYLTAEGDKREGALTEIFKADNIIN